MTKPIAIAQVDRSAFSAYGGVESVSVDRSKARLVRDGASPCTFYAPGWRPMVFRTVEAAIAKLESHPGFQGWTA